MMVGYFGYIFFTPRGLFSIYLVFSGLARAVSGWIDEPFGDPILTALDILSRGMRGRATVKASSASAWRPRARTSPTAAIPAAEPLPPANES